MSELISHEVQIGAVDGRGRQQANHLVEGNAAVYHSVLISFAEVPVHVSVNETEYDGLVANQCLVVTFAIRNGEFIGAAVSYFPEEAAGLPILVAFFLNDLDPVVRNVHRHAVVEAHASILEWSCQAGHA